MAVLTIPRLVAYFGTWALGIVAGGAALNGLIKARHDRDADVKLAESLAPFPDFTVTININDSLTAGGFLAAGELLLSIIAFWSFVSLVLASLSHHGRSSHTLYDEVNRRTERKSTQLFALGWWVFGLFWTFGTAVASLDYGVNRDATTKAYIAGVEVPAATVAQLQKATGLSSAYWVHGYTKFADISPWPLIVFTIASTVLTYLAYKHTPAHGAAVNETTAYGANNEMTEGRTSESIDEKNAAKHAEASV